MQIESYSQCSSNSIIIVTLGELYPEPDPQNGYSKDSKEFFRPSMTRLKPDPQDGYPKNSDNKFDLEWTIRSLTLKMDISRIQIYMQY